MIYFLLVIKKRMIEKTHRHSAHLQEASLSSLVETLNKQSCVWFSLETKCYNLSLYGRSEFCLEKVYVRNGSCRETSKWCLSEVHCLTQSLLRLFNYFYRITRRQLVTDAHEKSAFDSTKLQVLCYRRKPFQVVVSLS